MPDTSFHTAYFILTAGYHAGPGVRLGFKPVDAPQPPIEKEQRYGLALSPTARIS